MRRMKITTNIMGLIDNPYGADSEEYAENSDSNEDIDGRSED